MKNGSLYARWAMVVGLLVTAAPAVVAAVPNVMNVQGVLRNAGSQTVDGTYDLTFSLYSGQTGGEALWTETVPAVTVSGGLFSVNIGGTAAIDQAVFGATSSLWLGISVDEDPEMPRERVTSRGYAFFAQHAASASAADIAETAQGLSCSGCLDGTAFAEGTIGGDRIADGAINGSNIADGELSPSDVGFVYAGGTSKGGSAVDVACTGCVGAAEVDFPYAGSAQGGGAASDVACAGCISLGELAFAAVSQSDLTAAIAAVDIPQVTLQSIGCAAGEVPQFQGGAWGCKKLVAGGIPQIQCNGAYEVLQWDGAQFTCAQVLESGASTGLAKGFEAQDSWGYVWDGLERQAATWTVADAACKAKGGRLPTMTELYRVSGAGLSEVGNTYETNYLWSITQWDTAQHGRVRLTDGATAGLADGTQSAYRCVWPNNTADTFTGNHCYGPAGAECWTVATGGQRLNIDLYDRPPVTNVAAHDECNFYRAHVPLRRDFDENVPAGLANGTNNWIWTSDASRYDIVDMVRWSGTAPAYDSYAGSYVTWYGEAGNTARFRCIGVNYAAGAHPNAVANGYTAAETKVVVESLDKGLTKYGDAVSQCFAAGGHVPLERDMIEAVRGGLPNGTNSPLWTSDSSRYDLVQYFKWTATDINATGYHSTYTSWVNRGGATTSAYRCAYYPIDADYTGPTDGTCVSGSTCYSTSKGGDTKITLWADSFDRSPASYIAAVKACSAEGGHLAHARDYTELVRDGLPNGSNNWLWTSDGVDSSGQGVLIVKWLGLDPAFDSAYSGYATNSGKLTSTTRPYRCVWSNELY